MAMNRTWNHVDFANNFEQAKKNYEDLIKEYINRLRIDLDPKAPREVNPLSDGNLEAHIREYIIDPLLSALNWKTKNNLFIESAIRNQEIGSKRRFMDYLGIESDTNLPLLVVEAKRPNANLPYSADGSKSYRCEDLIAKALESLKDTNNIDPQFNK